MNRKLIRPNLADVKGKERESPNTKDQRGGSNNGAAFVRRPQFPSASPPQPPQPAAAPARTNSPATNNEEGANNKNAPVASTANAATEATAAANAAKNRRVPPPTETNAEIFYYKKQIDSHTLMVIVLTDNEEIEGTIEWYDRNAIKVNRVDAPNIMLLKHNIKYMYKADERMDSVNENL